MHIPIPRSQVADKLIWNGTKSGSYSVKTGYELACHMENNPIEGTSESSKDIFSKLWSTKVQRKNLHFIWRALHKSIPTVNNLRKRGIYIDRVCKRCLDKDEDELHCFLKCPHSRKVWDILLPGNDFSNSQFFHRWLEDQIVSGTPKHRSFIFTVLYSLWLARNKAVFDGITQHPSVISQAAIAHLDDFSHVTGSSVGSPATLPRRPAWTRPPTGTIKINFDAGCDLASGMGCGGAVARDSQGLVVLAGCFDFGWCGDAKFAEAKAAQKAMDLAVMMGFSSVIFEGDCKVVIDEIIRRNHGVAAQDVTEVEDIINSFLLGSTALSSWSILFTNRGNNSLAHYLASRRKVLVSDSLVFPPIPGWLSTLASCDVLMSDAVS